MSEIARRDVFQAIADPTRRRILDLIAEKPQNLNSLVSHFDISRPAISQHIKVLFECGMITIETVGRERFCKIETGNLIPAFLWLEKFKKEWTTRIDDFEQYINTLQKTNTNQTKNQNK